MRSLLGIGWLMCFCNASNAEEKIVEKGIKESWVFQIQYLRKGSRSEGVHGKVWNGKVQVLGKKRGESILVNGKKLIWYGAYKERMTPWASSGWLPKDLSKVVPSWKAKKGKKK